MEELDYYINSIKSGTWTKWANGKFGSFKDFDNNCLYRFQETTDYNGGCYLLATENECRNSPPVACGFVGFLIRYWGDKKTSNLYKEFFEYRITKYEEDHEMSPDAPERNLAKEYYDLLPSKEYDFITQYANQSKAVFDYISEQESRIIRQYIKGYYNHVRQAIKQAKANIKAEKKLTWANEGNPPPKADDENPVPYKLELSKELEEKVLKVYQFWNEQDDKKYGRKNIFKNTTRLEFFKMVVSADFSSLFNQKGIKHRVGYTVVVLTNFLGNEWGGKAATNLGSSIRELQKNTSFYEFEPLKNMFVL